MAIPEARLGCKPGTYIHEPAGEPHTLVITKDSPKPMMTVFSSWGSPIYQDKPADRGFAAGEEGFILLELSWKYYRQASLEASKLDPLIR